MERKNNRLALFYTFIILSIISFVLIFVSNDLRKDLISLFVGSASSSALELLHFELTNVIVKNDYNKLKAYTIISYIVRSLVYALLIILGIVLKVFSAILLVVGLSIYLISLVTTTIINLKKEE